MKLSSLLVFGAALSCLLTAVEPALAQGSAFTYQGRLNNGGSPASGSYDLTFALFSTSSGPGQVGSALTNTATAVSNGLFTVTLDFGNQFPGASRWLEIGVRTNVGGAFATLSPRQPLAPSPYAITAGNVTGPINGGLITAGTVTSTQLGSDVGQWLVNGASVYRNSGRVGILTTNPLASLHVADSQNISLGTPAAIIGIANSGHLEFDKGAIQAGSGFPALASPSTLYLNPEGGSVEVGASLTVDGNATLQGNLYLPATTGSAGTIYSGGQPFIHAVGNNNFFAGLDAGLINTSGSGNTASGSFALNVNTTGEENTANGLAALGNNRDGSYNTASGSFALHANTDGGYNTASGYNALESNTNGWDNTACGASALQDNTNGSDNTAIGYSALTFATGSDNIALGSYAGIEITTGGGNIDIGNDGVATDTNIIRIGSGQRDTYLAGIIHGNTNAVFAGNVGIGTTTPGTKAKLEINGAAGGISLSAFGNYAATTYGTYPGPNGTGANSIYASGRISAGDFIAFSDARIKRVEGRSDAARDLATLRGIEVTDFHYIDPVSKGTGRQKKVIAQQVEKVYPQAVSRSTDAVPDIYQKAEVKDGWVKLATNLKKGERVRLIGEKREGIHEVLEVESDKFRTDFATDVGVVFVYGREVKDFRSVDYEAIAMLNVSATQELARKLDAQQAAFTKLQDRLNQTLAEKETLLKHLAALEARDQARQDRLARIESHLEQGSARAKYTSLNVH